MNTKKSIFDENIRLIDFEINKTNIEIIKENENDDIIYTVNFAIHHSFNIEENLIKVDLSCFVNGVDKISQEKLINAEFKIVYIYKVKSLSQYIVDDDKGKHIQEKTAIRLNNISIATTRGLILSFSQNNQMKKFFIPILNTEK